MEAFIGGECDFFFEVFKQCGRQVAWVGIQALDRFPATALFARAWPFRDELVCCLFSLTGS